MDLSIHNIKALLSKPIIGIIPEDEAVRYALVKRHPVVHVHPTSNAAIGYKKLAASLIGKKYAEGLEKEKREPILLPPKTNWI